MYKTVLWKKKYKHELLLNFFNGVFFHLHLKVYCAPTIVPYTVGYPGSLVSLGNRLAELDVEKMPTLAMEDMLL